MPSPKSRAIIAAAGAAKTQCILNEVIAHPERQALITTFTNENLAQIEARLRAACGGTLPPHVTVMTWFTFLVNQCIRPYQRSVFGEPNVVGAFNFLGQRSRFTPKSDVHRYFLDSNRAVYRDGAADLACELERRSSGKVTARLAAMFQDIFIDELQDLNGYDLELLERLFRSEVRVTAVGDPRQHTFSTNQSIKNKAFKGEGLVGWIKDKEDVCELLIQNQCHRSNQTICDFADALFPHMPATVSMNHSVTGHDGFFPLTRAEVLDYYEAHHPVVLRYDRNTDTLGLPARNFGLSKGSTYDRVLIFPTKSWRKYFKDGDQSQVTSKEKFYVAVTRARFSVAHVID
ncbi:putative DNA helicase II / ATP-dependent DNA helicase PcrA (plasmid) [Nocardioides sp. JS614]|nr:MULTISPECIES: UvrD-helicase domain-containing protein [unclassified Nocardioides]ABL79347.1 putative DNA helicase II / ATP-dependent DNA helicase PcrA [Nocardioides sp. JS614]